MKYIVIEQTVAHGTFGDAYTEEFQTKEEAIADARSKWNRMSRSDQKSNFIYVLESANEDEDADDHFDGDYVWQSIAKYVVEYTDGKTGATSPIDKVTGTSDYTAEQYIEDCNRNADDEWCEILANGTVRLDESPFESEKERIEAIRR